MEESQLIIGAATDAGTVRERNEDLVYHAQLDAGTEDGQVFVLAVADGMGGYERGDVASRMAIDALKERLESLDTDDTVLILRQAYRRANERIYEGGSAQGEENMMGTTLVTALVRGNELTIANVGDSRAYLVRAGAMTQVTEDHSLIAEQVRMGVISEEEARESQHRNIITRALGHRPRVDVDVYELTLLPEDRLLLSTDGVHDFLDEEEIRDTLLEFPPEEASRRLIERALENGSTDNLTALCAWMAPVRVLREEQEEAAAPSEPSSLLMPILVAAALILAVLIIILIVVLV